MQIPGPDPATAYRERAAAIATAFIISEAEASVALDGETQSLAPGPSCPSGGRPCTEPVKRVLEAHGVKVSYR